MNTKQKCVIAGAAVLLVLNFVFPYASYPHKEASADGLSFRSIARFGPTPIWMILQANAKAQLPGNPFDDAVIQWPIVLAIAGAIVIFAGIWTYRLRHDSATTQSSASPATFTITPGKVAISLMHGCIVAGIYLAVKYFVGGPIIPRHIWFACLVAIVIAVLNTLPWHSQQQAIEQGSKEG